MIATSIDPGSWAGEARWRDGILEWCGKYRAPGEPYSDDHRLYIERPKIYLKGPHRTRNPANIITLAITAGRQSAPWSNVTWFEPHAWKGQVPDDVLYARLFRHLSDTELSIVRGACSAVAASYTHNILDAVGIGLYGPGRARRGMA